MFIIPGFNDAPEQARRIAELAASFAPDTVALNTAVRPPADGAVTACPPERLRELAALFGPAAQESGSEPAIAPMPLTEEALGALVSRHPVSVHTLAATFGQSEAEMQAYLERLAARGLLRLFEASRALFAGPR